MVLGQGSASDINDAGVVVGVGASGNAVRWDAMGRLSGLARPSDGARTHANRITDSGYIMGGAEHTQGTGPVRTTLLGQQDDENAMPLEDFLAETMTLLRTQPDAREIIVERAKFVRYAEANGAYDDVLAMLSAV